MLVQDEARERGFGSWWVWTRKGPRLVPVSALTPVGNTKRARAFAALARRDAEAHAKVVRSLMNPHAGRR